MFRRWLIITVLAAAALLPSCATNRETGRSSLQLVPEGTLNSLGAQAYQEVKQTSRESTDPRMTGIVRRVAQRIADVSGESFDWEVRLVETPEANAFVLPGGKIVVNTGILPICETEAGLAFVLGHEVGHAVARHGGERMSQTLLVQGGLTVAQLGLGNSPYAGGVMAALGMGAQYGVVLPFSRTHESEADHMGILYMARAGYDPRVSPDLWRRMGASGGAQPPEWTSTHPSHERRSADLEALMDKAMEEYAKAPQQYGVGESLK